MKVLQRRVQERNEALFSLDKNKIMAYLRKYNLPTEASSDVVFWAGIYKAICNIKNFMPSENNSLIFSLLKNLQEGESSLYFH